MIELVVASANPAKIAEVAEIMKDVPVKLITRDEIPNWPRIEEIGSSYLENALLKARALVDATGKAALADDSGIEVDALDGEPGIHSARWAGDESDDEANNAKLVSALSQVTPDRRTARYRCVAAIVFPDGRMIGGLGVCEGSIALEGRGSRGFGYDPWFIPQGETRTMAELSASEKHAISHRGRALRGLLDELRRTLPQ